MKNYDNIEELLADDTFYRWIEGQAEESENAFWDSWLAENPNHFRLLEQAKTIIYEFKNPKSGLEKSEIDAEAARILQTIQKPKFSWLTSNWLRIAASITLLVIVGLWLLYKKDINIITPSVFDNNSVQIVEIQNVSIDSTIYFQDGSTAQLKKGGSIQYDKDFSGNQRIVTLLSGEAFFEVTKNPQKPFIVFANDIVTKVVGTSFTVRTSNNIEGTSVVVRTGKVAVFKKSEFSKDTSDSQNFILLTPNQQITRKENTAPLVATVVEIPILIEKPTDNPDFVFDNAPVKEILQTLEKAYNVQIIADEAILKSCRITISLGGDPLFDKLQVICKVIGAKYEVSNTQIKLTGKGCK